MKEVGHSIIRASAGSGKTYALVKRMVRLLALGVKPENIVALTFTRKAAGEFFARLLQTLAEFAQHPDKAPAYLEDLSKNTQALCLKLLRSVIENMDRLRLGTLDSFFAAMVQSLPFELGLAGSGVIMSDHETTLARAEALDAVLVELMRPENDAARRELVESWKLATIGSEGNAPARVLEQWFEDLHESYLDCPEEVRWGPGKTIWPDTEAAIWSAQEDLLAAKARLEPLINVDAFDKRAVPKWTGFFEEMEAFRAGTPLGGAIEYMLEAKRGDPALLKEGRGEWLMYAKKPVALGTDASRALYAALKIIVGRELETVTKRTRGRCQLVGIYERAHRRLVRGAGRLTFDDLALLLSGKLNPGDAADWSERWEDLKRHMDFRLDAHYDHWLFDEFQDTSRRQWRVFANVVDELFQDPERRRSFFAVGDLKQSIYLWREAEPELFLGVESQYEGQLTRESLSKSWRSSGEVLAMVNDFFGNTPALTAALPGAMQWWRFETHEPSEKTRAVPGHAAVLTVGPRAEKDAALVALLRQIQPRERNLTCAVLTRGNVEAMRLAALLRRELECDVVCESQEAVAVDNAVTLALLSVMQLGAHPQDKFAWHHVRMTPLRVWVDREDKGAEWVGAEVRREVSLHGFLAVAEMWAKRLREVFPELDAFSEWRLRQFLDLCASFDESGSRDIDAFLHQAREHRVSATGTTRALQVMTVHKSKGLEFDIVILPDLQAAVLDDARRTRLLSKRGKDGEMEWLLDKPPALVTAWDGRLVKEVELLESRAAFEGLCRLYVAMTRAKQGLYVLQYTGTRSFPSNSEAGLLQSILKDAEERAPYELPGAPAIQVSYERGARNWYESHPIELPPVAKSEPTVAKHETPLGDLLRRVNQPVQRRTPSGEESFHLRGSDLLTPQREVSRRLGTLVHELFEAVEWLEGEGGEALLKKWRSRGLHQRLRFEEAAAVVTKALADAEVRKFFTNPSGTRTAWRERRFDLLLDKEWITGTLDRVVLDRDAKGARTGATVVDFKTDSAASLEEAREKAKSYAPQLEMYNKAVQRLTGLKPEKIKTALIFVAGPWVVEV